MNRSHSTLRFVGCTLIIVVGLGLGFWIGRRWKANPPPPQADTPVMAQIPAENSRGREPSSNPGATASGKRALLVGVTKYDHLPKERHLAGPGNDVRLMRKLLQESYRFATDAIVSLTEDEGRPDRRPIRANIEREFRRLAEQAREGDQVVILLAGHGARQPADLDNREPDGIDEIFLPADVDKWRGFPEKVPNSLVDKEMGKWLHDITDDAIVSLTEDEGRPDRRPIRANIEREFRRLAEQAREGDQVVILLAGHGARQPADLDNREPDGIDEIFLPADVDKWRGFPEKVPNSLVDKEMGKWLHDITEKKAYVWIIFDCCHSGTMTRGIEVVRELPPGLLVPDEELNKARLLAAQRGKTRGGPAQKPAAYVPQESSDYLVAVYACRESETTPESPQPADSATAKYHGLLTYSLVDILTKSAASKAPLTYRELVQRLQVRYAARRQGAPATPLVEGRGQGLVVLGTEQPTRPRLLLSRDEDDFKVNAGDLYGLTRGSILAVYSPAGTDVEPKLLGHVRVVEIQPFEATVEPCAYEKSPLVKEFPPLATCKPVSIDYRLRRFKVAVRVPEGQTATRSKLLKALEPLSGAKEGLVEIVDEKEAQWLVRLDKGKVQLVEASGNRVPFALPDPDSPDLGEALRKNLEKVYRARNLIEIAKSFEGQRDRGDAPVDVEVEVLRHKSKSKKDLGEVSPAADGRLFRPGDFISFRVKNNSSLAVDLTLLIVGSDFQIQPFYPIKGDVAKALRPGETIDTPWPWGGISNKPPFGSECLVVIAVPETSPPADFSALAQDGLARSRSADGGNSLKSPLGELLESAMFRSNSRNVLPRTVAVQHGMRVLTFRTEAQ